MAGPLTVFSCVGGTAVFSHSPSRGGVARPKAPGSLSYNPGTPSASAFRFGVLSSVTEMNRITICVKATCTFERNRHTVTTKMKLSPEAGDA